jgi:hypothetical protein
MERADPWKARRAAHQRRDPLAHLARGLVGERHRQRLLGNGLALGQEVGDTVREDAGLARAGAGQDQDRAVGCEHGGALRGIQVVEIHRLHVK